MENTVILNDVQADYGAFLEARKTHIGSSDIAALVGLDPYKSPISVWMDKKGFAENLEESDSIWFGKAMEDLVAERFAQKSGLKLSRSQQMFTHKDHAWASATPDYFAEDGSIVEIKTTEQNWSDGVPERVVVQVTWQMGITGRKKAIVCALGHRRQIMNFEIEFDQGLFDGLLTVGSQFVTKYLDTNTPPPPMTPDDAENLKAIWKPKYADAVQLPDETSRHIVEWETAREKKSALQKELNECDDKMKLAEAFIRTSMQENTFGRYANRIVEVKEITRKGYVVKESKYQSFKIKTEGK